jgi:CRP/FNR family transcriptional regulator, cyclic AMP receptor protein
MPDMLELAAHLPAITVQPGEVLCSEGDAGGPIWVLVDGSLTVTKSGAEVNAIHQAGSIIGEIAVLTGNGPSATVVARTPCTLRYAADGAAFLRSNPEISTHVATGLARRLDFVTTYLADLKNQYGDAPGLAMVGEVLQRLSMRQVAPARPGSARETDPPY